MPYTPKEKPCSVCKTPFMPRHWKQSVCAACATALCVDCGGKKDARSPRCRACDTKFQRGISKGRRPEKPIETVIAEVEAIGLRPDKQYAFGYVIGVIFGDGCVSRVTDKIKHRCTDGSITVNTETSYRPLLMVTEEWFAHCFANQWCILTGRTVTVRKGFRSNFETSTVLKRKDYTITTFTVHPRSASVGRYLHHLKYKSAPAVLLKFPLDVFSGITQGMIDSEGYICAKYIDVSNMNIALLHVLAKMFNQLGTPARVYLSPSQKGCGHLRLKPPK